MTGSRHVSKSEAEAVAEFASDVAFHLSLPRYRFLVMEDPCEDDSLASISTVQNRWVAQISLNRGWMKRDDLERMDCVIHEVCHLLHRHVDEAVSEFQRYTHPHEYDPIAERYTRETELMVDHLAGFLSDYSTVKKAWADCHKKPPVKRSPSKKW